MSAALCVIAESAAVALRLAAGRGDRRLFMSYGIQVPLASEFDSLAFWMADAYASRVYAAGLTPALAAPGWDWMSTLDPELTQRTVVSTTMDRLPEGTMFIKPAQLKLVDCPAGIWDAAEFRQKALDSGASPQMHVQYCEQRIEMNHEHRFVVCDGQVLTGSPYRVDGRAYFSGLSSTYSEQAASYAADAVRALGSNCPVACSLDVARDERTGRWLIVEANPLWSSGPYACDPDRFVDGVQFANTAGTGQWSWVLDETQVLRAGRAEPVVAVSEAEATGYVEYLG